MDKNKIKKFAINARHHLRDTVEVKLAGLGITADKINNELPISTTDKKYYVDDNENNALTGAQIAKQFILLLPSERIQPILNPKIPLCR